MIRKQARVAFVLTAIVALAVLASGASAKTSGPAGATAKTLTHLDIGLALQPPKMTMIGFYVAQDKGFFRKNGLDVKLVGFDDGVKGLRGVASGTVDLGGTSSDDIIAAAAQGGGIKAVWSYEMPLDTTVVADDSVKTLADLKGKNLGITSPGGFADVQIRAALRKASIDPGDAHFISVANRSALLTGLVAGRINATVFHADDGFTANEQDPKVHNLLAMNKALSAWWYGAVAANTDWIASNGPTIVKFIKAMDQAHRWMYTHKAGTVAIGVKYTQESPTAVSHAYDFLKKMYAWTVNTGLQRSHVLATMQKEAQLGQIPKVPAYTDVVDLRWGTAAVKQIGRWKHGY